MSKKIKEVKGKRALYFPPSKEIGDYEDLLLNDLLGAPYKPLKDDKALPHRDENPVVYFEVGTEGGRIFNTSDGVDYTKPQILGKMHFELRNDICPVAVANFLSLCQGERGYGRDGVKYHYKGLKIHRIVKNVLFQCGDLLDSGGECSRSIYNNGGVFRDENFIFRHTGAGCLSYCNRGADTNGSLFQVIFSVNPDLDNKYVCFGCMASSESYVTLNRINDFGSATGEPTEVVRIRDCGLAFPLPPPLVRKKVNIGEEGSDDEEEQDEDEG